jgi:two-component system, response regulator
MQDNGGYILLVEDNKDDVELARLALQETGIANPVVVASDGVEALDYLFATGTHAGRDTSHMPRVVLLDVNLPRVNGLQVLQRLREHTSTELLPVVMLTSSDEQRDVQTSYRSGANSYVRKPMDFGQFVETVRQLGSYWLLLNVPAS